MEIIEEPTKISHELLTIQLDEKKVELVDICKAEDGEFLSVNVGSVEISSEAWEILKFLEKEGKL